MAEVKPCPKCDGGVLEANNKVVAIPAVLASQLGGAPIQTSQHDALPLQFWLCSNCQYVELYYCPLS
jgi:hypothetical protein